VHSIEEGSFNFAGCDVRFRATAHSAATPANGETLMLISGLGGTMAFWNTAWPLLARHYRLITFDHPGMGASADPAEPPSVGRLADLAVALLGETGVDRAVIVGHSMGGAIAQTIAIEHPGRIRALVLSSTWARPDHYFHKAFAQRKMLLEQCGANAYARAQTLSVLPPEWIAANPQAADAQEQRAAASFRNPAVLARRIDAVMAFDRTADLGRVSCPTLVVYCSDDQVVPPHMSVDLARQIPDARQLALTGGGHFAPVITADIFYSGVLQFIDKLGDLNQPT